MPVRAPVRPARLAPFPASARVRKNHLCIGGIDTVELAAKYGTPLYAFDAGELRARCRAFRRALRRAYGKGSIFYAAKAGLPVAMAHLIAREGLGLDVASGGELGIAQAAAFPPARLIFHGNNKGADELRQALGYGVGAIVVDSFDELHLLAGLARRTRRIPILLRVTPTVVAETHPALATAGSGSKFGFPLADGQAREAVSLALQRRTLAVLGLHFHIGSQITDLKAYRQALSQVMAFAAAMRADTGFVLRRLNVGGGFAIAYGAHPARPISAFVEAIADGIRGAARRHRLPLPELDFEPGRAIAGPPGVALYRVGVRKRIPSGRWLVAVDGGIADNPRPAFYSARYSALLANRANDRALEPIIVAGRYCEAGDILIPHVRLPPPRPGDLLAVAATGAYCLAMASNYNGALRPPIVFLERRIARLVRRRETVRDLLRCERPS